LNTSKESIRKKRKRAAWDENYFLNCLAQSIQDAVALQANPSKIGNCPFPYRDDLPIETVTWGGVRKSHTAPVLV
jgi:hypothetical protein